MDHIHHLLLLFLLTLLPLTSLALSDLGINCRGSWFFCWSASNTIIPKLKELVPYINPRDVYELNREIICFPHTNSGFEFALSTAAGFCLFFQGSDAESNIILFPSGNVARAVNGSQIQEGVRRLIDHGCRSCGSVPVDFDLNDPHRKGLLTVNWVSDRHGCADALTFSNICAPQYRHDSPINPYVQWDNWRPHSSSRSSSTSKSVVTVTSPFSAAPTDGPSGFTTVNIPAIGFFTIEPANAAAAAAATATPAPSSTTTNQTINNLNPLSSNNDTTSSNGTASQFNSANPKSGARPITCASFPSTNTSDPNTSSSSSSTTNTTYANCDDGSGGIPSSPFNDTSTLTNSTNPPEGVIGILGFNEPPRPLNDTTSSGIIGAEPPDVLAQDTKPSPSLPGERPVCTSAAECEGLSGVGSGSNGTSGNGGGGGGG